ncbi:hypothetical protein L7F22_007924 [Adiantum nelumboides]|nr:hypothetical protein [Adiantum nelumboides]
MEIYFANHELVEPKKVALAASLLKDTAFLWWQRRVALGKTTHTWENFKQVLYKAFIPASADFHARSALRHLCQTGSVAAYISQFQKLNLEIMTLSLDDLLHYFIDGLEPNLRDDVHKANPLTVEDAISYVERLGDFRCDGDRPFGRGSRVPMRNQRQNSYFNSRSHFGSSSSQSQPTTSSSTRKNAWSPRAQNNRPNFNGDSSAYHPQTDGQTEKVNQILEEMLRHYIQIRLNTWKEYLPLVEFAYNNSFRTAVGMTPFQAAFGHTPLVPTNFVIQHKVALADHLVNEMQDLQSIIDLNFYKHGKRFIQPFISLGLSNIFQETQ